MGAGMKKIEMNFLPDIYVECDECNGKRFNIETLMVKLKGKSISEMSLMFDRGAVAFSDDDLPISTSLSPTIDSWNTPPEIQVLLKVDLFWQPRTKHAQRQTARFHTRTPPPTRIP